MLVCVPDLAVIIPQGGVVVGPGARDSHGRYGWVGGWVGKAWEPHNFEQGAIAYAGQSQPGLQPMCIGGCRQYQPRGIRGPALTARPRPRAALSIAARGQKRCRGRPAISSARAQMGPKMKVCFCCAWRKRVYWGSESQRGVSRLGRADWHGGRRIRLALERGC